jgi:hypothetical protein
MAPLALMLALVAQPEPSAQLLRALTERPAGAERAVAATAQLIGRRYLLSPLGEGAGPDPDPRFRLDAFDCVTFVETAIAFGTAQDLSEAAALMDDIRYDGPPTFDRRNHYVIPQWIPANLKRGWIEDVADEVAGLDAVDAIERYDDARWKRLARARATLPHLSPAAYPRGVFTARMVPIGRVLALADRIPDGTIVWVARDDRPTQPTRVTHGGLIVVGERGERRVRHASSSAGTMRVVEEPLERFIRRQDSAHPGWPVSGLLLLRIRDNQLRVDALRRG